MSLHILRPDDLGSNEETVSSRKLGNVEQSDYLLQWYLLICPDHYYLFRVIYQKLVEDSRQALPCHRDVVYKESLFPRDRNTDISVIFVLLRTRGGEIDLNPRVSNEV